MFIFIAWSYLPFITNAQSSSWCLSRLINRFILSDCVTVFEPAGKRTPIFGHLAKETVGDVGHYCSVAQYTGPRKLLWYPGFKSYAWSSFY